MALIPPGDDPNIGVAASGRLRPAGRTLVRAVLAVSAGWVVTACGFATALVVWAKIVDPTLTWSELLSAQAGLFVMALVASLPFVVVLGMPLLAVLERHGNAKLSTLALVAGGLGLLLSWPLAQVSTLATLGPFVIAAAAAGGSVAGWIWRGGSRPHARSEDQMSMRR